MHFIYNKINNIIVWNQLFLSPANLDTKMKLPAIRTCISQNKTKNRKLTRLSKHLYLFYF